MARFRPVTKTCKACREVLAVEHFYRNSSAKDGYRARCKLCERWARHPKLEAPLEPSGRPGIYDTPHGEKICDRCNKLIPLDAYGQFERHFNGVIDYGATHRYEPKACEL